MIDTINLKIHNFNEYTQLYAQLYTTGKKAISEQYIDEDTGELTTTRKIRSLFYHNSNNIIPLSQRNSLHIASSSYNISYFINQEQNFLDVNLSIPKFFWGCNIMQSINYYDTSAHGTFIHLKRSIDYILKAIFIQIPKYEDIEVSRIDLCYNHHFANNTDSLVYLEEQKKLLTKYARSTANDFRTYDTSWMYKTQRYTFKCYHKGEEFSRNDLKKLYKSNPLKLDLSKLIKESAKILRYEITVRPAHIKYLCHHNFYESKKESAKYKSHPVARFVNLLKVHGEDELYNKFQKFTCKITLASLFDKTPDFNKLALSESITFDETIFTLIYNDFWRKVQKFQLNTKPSTADTIALIRRRNADNKKKKVKKDSSLIVMAALLSSYHSTTELYKLNLIPRITHSRLKKELLDYGINDTSDNLPFNPPPTNYDEYKQLFKHEHFMALLA